MSIEKCSVYVENYWKRLLRYNPKDNGVFIGIPNPYIASDTKKFTEMFYWDSYFTILGLLANGEKKLAKGIVDNCIYMADKYGIIPNANRKDYMNRSQPPYLTSMIREIYSVYRDDVWLKKAFAAAKKEYAKTWTSEPRITNIGLSKFHGERGSHFLAEKESGWDFTSRFGNRANDMCAIDLNCCLFKYESDFAFFSRTLGDIDEADRWMDRSIKRKYVINAHMWDPAAGFFYDYDLVNKMRMGVRSLAAYSAMWSGLASNEQAKQLVKNLRHFEHNDGLATCDQDYGMRGKQWNYPIGWAPLHWIVVSGLHNYRFMEERKRITAKWLGICAKVFEKTGKMWEKYNVVDMGIGMNDPRYGNMHGFGWTNGVFIAMKEKMM